MTIGENIREYRKNIKMTQKELAEKVGVTASTITKYEKGDLEPNLNNLTKIAEALECNISSLVTDSSDLLSIFTDVSPDVIQMYRDIEKNNKVILKSLYNLFQTVIKQDNEIFIKYNKLFGNTPTEYLNIEYVKDVELVISNLGQLGSFELLRQILRSMIKDAAIKAHIDDFTKDMD